MSYQHYLDTRLVYIIAGILFSSTAQIFMKLATRYEVLRFTWFSLLAGSVLSYLLSFFMYYLVLKHFPISKISPVMTIGVVILVVIFGIFTGEILSTKQMMGILLGVLSILLLLV